MIRFLSSLVVLALATIEPPLEKTASFSETNLVVTETELPQDAAVLNELETVEGIEVSSEASSSEEESVSQGEKSEVKPTLPKTDSSSYFGITETSLFTPCQTENEGGKSFPKEIKGVVLVGRKEDLLSDEELSEVEGLDARVDLPARSYILEQQLVSYYYDQPWNEATISSIESKVYEFYQKYERPFILITVPPQRKKTKVLQLIIQESTLGKVEVVGNKWTSSSRYLKYFSTQPGEPISLKKMSKDVYFINRNPFRHVSLIYSPGTEENETDLTIDVTDRKPYRFYTGFDNTGVSTTGRGRVFAGVIWDQIFDLDHSVFYQYTTNYNASRFHANTFQYTAMLPSETILNLYGGFSIVHADISSPNKRNKWTNIQGSGRYIIPFTPSRDFMHEFTVGLDIKNTNNTMEFVDGTPIFGQTVNLSQVMAGYQCKWEKARWNAECGIEAFYSPAQWLPDQSKADFGSLRPNADNKWIYFNAFGKVFCPLPRSFAYYFFTRGQITGQVLLPSEQLGIGGYDSVRGYDERQYNADTGFFMNHEIHFPSFSLFRIRKTNADRMYFLVFFDLGVGMDNRSIFGVKEWDYLIGVGPGVRYSLSSYLTGHLDYGFKLHHQDNFTGSDIGMIHFSITGGY